MADLRADWLLVLTEQQGLLLTTLGVAAAAAAFLLLVVPRGASAERAVPFSVPAPEASRADWHGGPALPQPLSIKIPNSTAIQCFAPATGQSLGTIEVVTPAGVDRIVAAAATAQRAWATTTFAQRRRVLRTLLAFMLDHTEVIVRTACRDSGKTRVDAMFGEILVTAVKLRWTIEHGERTLRPDRRPTNLLMFYKHNEVHYEPLGVVAACVSWNYPFHNLMGPIISSLFAGNAVVIKNSELTAWSSAYFISIVRGALAACGHSPDLVHAISCWPDTAAHLAAHPGIAHLTFIGSRPVAHEVARSAANALTPLCVELGGKDAAIVLDNPNGRPLSPAKLQTIASMLMRGCFQSGGQNCVGIERVIAQPGAYAALIALLEPRVRALRLGDDLSSSPDGGAVDVGAMQCPPAAFDRLEQLIAQAVQQGARLLVGGKRFAHPQHPAGQYFAPTLLVDVTPEMAIAQQELFAPVCLVFAAAGGASGSLDSVLALANSTPAYSLGCSVFGPVGSAAARAALARVTAGVRAGMVAVNDVASYYVVQLPFGGVGGSGYGRFAGAEGLRAVCNAKSVCADRWPGLIQTAIPGNLDYPMEAGTWLKARGIVELGFGEDWSRRLMGIRRLVGL